MDSDESGRRENRRPRAMRRATPGMRRDGQRGVSGTSAVQTGAANPSISDDAIHPATAVLQNDYVRRYLGTFIHTATRNDIRSRVAVHRAIPVLVSDLGVLFRQREHAWSHVLAIVISLARHARSRDVAVAEREALRDAWAVILEGAPNRRQALTAATRQVSAWRVADALPWLVSAMPAQALFVDGIIRAPDVIATVAAQTHPRNALRLRGVAAMLADTEDDAYMSMSPAQVVARSAPLIDALAPAYNVDPMQPGATDALRMHVAEWAAHGWLPSLLAALPASLDRQAGEGLPGVAELGQAMRRAHRVAQGMQWSDEVYGAASAFESTTIADRIPHQHRFRLVYALHDALRDADHRPSTSVDAIAAQFASWHGAGVLPLLAVATIDDYFYRDGRLRLADIDAHLTREWALMRSLPSTIRDIFYDRRYSGGPTDDEAAARIPALPVPIGDAAMLRLCAYVEARVAENQFRILEGILLRECTDFVARRHLQTGLAALRGSPLLARFNDPLPASWYETLLTNPQRAPFNAQIITILDDVMRAGYDIDESTMDWVTGLHVGPATLGAVWRQRETFRCLSDRYREGIALQGGQRMPDTGIGIGLDAYLMFESHIGDRRAQAFSRWIDRSGHRALDALAPVVLCEWVALLLNVSISDATVDQWLAEWEGSTLAEGMAAVDDARLAMHGIASASDAWRRDNAA